MNMTILVPATIASALLSAMVFASTPAADSKGTPAKAPNRAEVFAVATCGVPAPVDTIQTTGWHTAPAQKLVRKRALVKAKASGAEPCDPIRQ